MTDQKQATYRHVLRSTSIAASATVATLVIGLARTKILALMLGPVGIGLIGLWMAILSMGTSIAGMGLHSSGVRQVASTAHDPAAAELSLRALWTLSILLATAGGLLVWLFRRSISIAVVGSAGHADSVGWIALGVGLSILGGAQIAAIQGFRRIGDFARLQVSSNLVAAIAGIGAVAIAGERGILPAVLAAPAAAVPFGYWYARRLPRGPRTRFSFSAILPAWKSLIGLGLAITATAIMSSFTQMAARTIVIRQMGLDEAGFFQAAWSISAVNMGLVLASMGTDYYPRLSAAASDRASMTEHVNQQIHVGLVLAGPILTGVTALAPIVLKTLFSSAFTEATHLLQWLTAADALRLTGWSLGFVMLARQATVSYIAVEAAFGLIFLPLMWSLGPIMGLEAVGLAYFVGYLACLLLALLLAWKVHGVRVTRSNLLWTLLLTLLLLALILGFRIQPVAAGILGTAAALALGLYSVAEIHRMGINLPVIGSLIHRAAIRLRVR